MQNSIDQSTAFSLEANMKPALTLAQRIADQAGNDYVSPLIEVQNSLRSAIRKAKTDGNIISLQEARNQFFEALANNAPNFTLTLGETAIINTALINAFKIKAVTADFENFTRDCSFAGLSLPQALKEQLVPNAKYIESLLQNASHDELGHVITDSAKHLQTSGVTLREQQSPAKSGWEQSQDHGVGGYAVNSWS